MYFVKVETNFLTLSILGRNHIEYVEGSVEQYDLEDAIRWTTEINKIKDFFLFLRYILPSILDCDEQPK